jgi:DNA-directed RNA polymerase specialized sigma24 family protein
VSEQSPFAALESSFLLLCAGPSPLAVHGREVGPPVPRREVPLTELGGILLHPSTHFDARDRIVRHLVGLAQANGGSWTVGLAGVLLPGLRSALADVARAYPERAADMEADALVELIAVLAEFDAESERVASRLLWRAAQRARRRAIREQAAASGRVTEGVPTEPHRPWGHPDFVLAEAVSLGILEPDDAEVIGETRLGGVSMSEIASRTGRRVAAVRKQRERAEDRLVTWLGGKSAACCRETASDASFRGAGRSPVVDEAEPARVAQTPAGTAREVSPLARRSPATGAARPGLAHPTRRSA